VGDYMLKINVLPADTYTVINKSVLNEKDKEILVMLYQPIIGASAISLYLTLWSYLDKEEISSTTWTHHHLINNLQTKLLTIIESREKLEAIGLLKSYFKKGDINDFVYELYSPLSAYDFFANPILNISLFNNIGRTDYTRLVNRFKVPKINLTEYEDITCLFNEVFESKDYTSYERVVDDLKRQNKRDLTLENKIDLNNIVSLIPEDVLNHKSITKELKDLIYKLAFIYDLDDANMSMVIRNSINEKKAVDKENLRINSRNYYKFENNGKLPSVIFKNQPDYLKSTHKEVSKRTKLIYQFENTSPFDFLTLKNNNVKPSKNDLLLLEELLVDMNLMPGVVNVLIDYVLKINNNKLTKAFVITIATQWKRSNIMTVEDAMEFAGKEQKVNHKKVPYNKTKTLLKPEWIDKDMDKDEASKDEQQRVNDLLKEFK
jgi:replication initiation and membrane attachment protein